MAARRGGWIAALAIVLVMRVFDIASAHATLVSSDPAAGSSVASMPARIRLVFSEPVESGMASVSLVGSGVTVKLPASGDPHDVHAILADAGGAAAIPPGGIRLEWHIVSADGHPVGGSFVFSVGSPVPVGMVAAPDTAMAPDVTVWGPAIAGAPLIPAIFRGVGVGCLIALCGLLSFIALSGTSAARPSHVALGLSIATPLFLGMHLLAWMVNTSPTHHLDSAWLASLMSSTVGKVELWRTALSLLPLWALALARRPGLGLALAIPSLLASAAVGHSAAIQPLWAVPLKAIHLAALAVWFGGLIWIIVRERGDAHTTATDVARVSTLALWAVVAVTVSGIAQTLILVQSTAGVRSPYGGVVIAKILGLAVLVGFGAYHRRRFVPAIASRGEAVAGALRTSVARELSVFCIVILLGGFLAYLSPPTRGAVNAGSHSSEHVP